MGSTAENGAASLVERGPVSSAHLRSQKNLDELGQWAEEWHMEFNAEVLHWQAKLGQG